MLPKAEPLAAPGDSARQLLPSAQCGVDARAGGPAKPQLEGVMSHRLDPNGLYGQYRQHIVTPSTGAMALSLEWQSYRWRRCRDVL